MSLRILPSLVALVQQRLALPARHRCAIISGDPFHLGPMSRFFVARVAQHHPVVIEGVQVTPLSSVAGHWSHPEKGHANSQ
jgi:hypothetical protein